MSPRKSRVQSLQQSKARRQKRIAIAGGVVLAVLLAWEVPHYLGGSSSPKPAATTSAAATGSSTTTLATSPGTTTPATTGAGAGTAATLASPPTTQTKLPNSDVAPSRTRSELYSFDTFAGKDPFVQQISQQPVIPGSGSPSGGSSGPSATPAGSGSGSSGAVQQASTRTLATRGVATIDVNGKSETVRVGASFPSANPVFRLVSLAKGAANIGIANGSYASGAQTVRLTSGRPLTLVDTADGIRYKLRLLSAS